MSRSKSTVASIVLNNFVNDSRVLKECLSLHKHGYDVTVVALHDEGQEEREIIQGIPVHRIKLLSRKWSKKRAVQLFKYLEFLYKAVHNYKKYDIIHCNDLNALPVGAIIKMIFNRKARIVYDAHEYEINDVPNEKRWSIRLKYLLEKFLIRYADKVMTVSDSIANEYVRLYNIKKPALVLNTPPYQEVKKRNLFRERFGISKDTAIFLYQGGLSAGRGVEVVLEAFKDAEDDKNAIVFMGYGPLEEHIKEASRNHNNIFFHEAVTPDLLLDYTSSADFGIATIEDSCLSYKYCLPNKMFEYIMAEIPVIVSNLPEMKRVIKTYGIGVVAEENTPQGLLTAIQEAQNLDKRMLREKIKEVKKRYNWQTQEKVLIEVYKELA